MDQHQNRDGVIVSAELIADDAESEHAGLWHTVDANGVEGHVTDEQFQRNFTKVDASASRKTAPAAEK